MLMPAAKTANWQLLTGGIYAKYARSNFTLQDSSNWLDNNADSGGAFMLYKPSGGNTSGVGGILTSSLSANQPVVVEWFAQQSTSNAAGVFECGWSSTGDGSVGVSLRFYADGKCEIWKTGVMLETASIGGKSSNYEKQGTKSVSSQAPPAYVQVLLIPCRGRELLVLGSTGGGFSHIFDDIPEQTPSPIITLAQPFWFNIPAPFEANIRIAALQYESPGTLIGKLSYFRTQPVGSLSTTIYQDVTAPSATGFAADGITYTSAFTTNANGVRINVSLTGGTTTPFVYGARAYSSPVTGSTPAVNTDVSGFVHSASVNFTDSISGLTGEVILMQPAALEAAGVSAVSTTSHRPITLVGDGYTLLSGIAMTPKWVDAYGFTPAGEDQNQNVEFKLKDFYQQADDFLFYDDIPLDGMDLKSAYELVASLMSLSANVSSTFAAFTLPEAGAPTSNGWNMLIKAGDKGSQWLDRLHKTFCADAFHGVDGTGQLQLIDPDLMPTSPVVTLYDSVALAIAAGSTIKNVFRHYNEQSVEPEANDLYVVGTDFRTQRPIVVHKGDAGSIDPTPAPADRPDNWLGFQKGFSWIDPSLTTLDACKYVIQKLYNKLTPRRALGEFEIEFSTDVYRGQMVQLNFTSGDVKLMRVKSMKVDFKYAATQFEIWRPCRVIAEVGISSASSHTHGTSLAEIIHEIETRGSSRHYHSGFFELKNKSAGPPIEQYEA